MIARVGMGRTALLGVVVVVFVLIIGGVLATSLSNKSTATRSTTSSSSSTSSSPTKTSTATSTSTSSPIGYNLSQPIGAAYDSANGDLYVTNNDTNSVSVIDVATDQLVTTVGVGFNPAQVAYDPVNDQLFVTNNSSGSVTAISGATNEVVAASIQTNGLAPDGIVFDPDDGLLYVAEHGNGEGGNGVAVINATTDTYVKSIPGIWEPTGAAYDPMNGAVYVTTGGSTVMVINSTTDTMTSQITVGQEPRGIAYDPSDGYLYVANSLQGTVSVISPGESSVVATIDVSGPVASVPYLCAYDPADGYVMVTNDYSSGVNVINGTKLVGGVSGVVTTGFQSEPAALAYDSTDQMMYVVDHATDAVVAIAPALTSTYLTAPGAVTTSSAPPNQGNFGGND